MRRGAKDNFDVLIERNMLLLAETGKMLTLGRGDQVLDAGSLRCLSDAKMEI